MNKLGKNKEKTIDEDTNYNQYVVNCIGENDQRKYFEIMPFGIASSVPIDYRVLVADSQNKDVKCSIGVMNKIIPEDLNVGDTAVFSTDEAGENILGKIVCRNTGAIEINKDMGTVDISMNDDGSMDVITSGNVSIIVDGDATIATTGATNVNADGDVAITAGGNATVDATQFSVNDGNLTVD